MGNNESKKSETDVELQDTSIQVCGAGRLRSECACVKDIDANCLHNAIKEQDKE